MGFDTDEVINSKDFKAKNIAEPQEFKAVQYFIPI